MSYLSTPRLTFSGKFQADPSTVNNDPLHFNNATFQPSFQEYSGPGNDPANGWWNPDGTGNWRFIGCTVTSVTYQDGTVVTDPAIDPIIGASIMDTDQRTAAKIVDLDSQNQGVSEIWGLVVRLVSSGGDLLMSGEYEVAAFTNLWFSRLNGRGGDGAASASYQSTIKVKQWDLDVIESRYLQELMEVSPDELSIKFNLDMYNDDFSSPNFTLGRIAGAVGPYFSEEPVHTVLGRQLAPLVLPKPYNAPGTPFGTYSFATAVIDDRTKELVLDLGNSLQFNSDYTVNNQGTLQVVLYSGDPTNPIHLPIGIIDYLGKDWYMRTSGICTYTLSDELYSAVQHYSIAILSYTNLQTDVFSLGQSGPTLLFNETSQSVCADKFVFRLNPNPTAGTTNTVSIDFYVTCLGKPIQAEIALWQTGSSGANPPLIPNPLPSGASVAPPDPVTGIPTSALNISANPILPTILQTDETGKGTIEVTFSDPGLVREFQQYVLSNDQTAYNLVSYSPQQFMDGQLYTVNYCINGEQNLAYPNPSNTLSLMIFNSSSLDGIPQTWPDFIQPIMQQYANLYPLMSKGVFNLADQQVFEGNAQILKMVFSKDPKDPNYMPATRDLSDYKKTVILNYLQQIISK